ncbi:MAG: hypothetical protein U0736_17150 [Gemmataceae bacterium]
MGDWRAESRYPECVPQSATPRFTHALCTGPTCCAEADGLAAWEALKAAVKEQGLHAGPHACYRSKVGCLRVCMQGPIAVVYPEGTWYHGMTADRIPRLVQEHLIDGRPIEEWIFARNPLPAEDE